MYNLLDWFKPTPKSKIYQELNGSMVKIVVKKEWNTIIVSLYNPETKKCYTIDEFTESGV